jgi:hypothetical protein
VECQCKGEGVGPPVGVRDDGSRCSTPFSLETDVAAPTVRLALVKPGRHPDQLKLHAIATGDEGFNATFSRRTVLFRDGSAVALSDDGLHARVFGLAFDWSHSKPASLVSMALDMAKQQYSATIEHEFTLSLECAQNATGALTGNRTICPQDGDTIETTIQVTPQAGQATPSLPSSSAVRIMAEVQAAICCERTKPTVRVVANTDLDRISSSAPLSVHLRAMDMDDQPVGFSRAELELTWDGVAVPFGWLRGQSEYSWQIPPDRDEGEHKIVVRLNGSDCTLLSVTVTVAYRTQMILAMSIAGVAIVTLAGMMAYQIRAHQEQVKRFVESFLKHEGVLAVKIGWDAWVRPSLPALCNACRMRHLHYGTGACRISAETVRGPPL